MLTIYSLGDPWYLGKVMDAIAMISGSQSGFIGASEVAALIGVIIIGFQSILRLQINIHHLLVCYIVYMGCFSTTTDVAIESVYSDKTVIQKDNVPFGPAVLGSVISQIGFGLSQKMEVAFSDTDTYHLTKESGGFLNPLYVINNLANWAEGGSLLDLMEKLPEGKDMARNYQTYLADCTTKAIYLGRNYGGKTYNDVFSQPMGPDIKFDSELYGTEFIEQNGTASVLSCKAAYEKLENQLETTITALDSNNAAQLKIKSKIQTECKTGNRTGCLANGVTVIETVQDVLDQMHISNTTAQKFMLASVLENLKKTGLAIGFRHYQDISTANMLVQSVQQRNLQWASEGSLFLNAMRPMMSFIEGFFYAISPFAAIIMLLGLFGLNIFFKYIMLLLWIQLWTPIMTIANLFIMTSAKEAIADSLGTVVGTVTGLDSSNALSTYLYEDIIKICQDKIAVGSMMLAATPVLSLMIISGSVFAFTSLTNRIAGADHFNEKTVAPDVVNPGAVMDQKAMFASDNYGTQATGANFASVSIGQQAQNLLSYTRQQMESANAQYNQAFSNAMTDLGNFTRTNGVSAAFNKLSDFTQSNVFQNMRSQVEGLAKSGTFGSNVTASDVIDITAGAVLSKLGLSGGIKGDYQLSNGTSLNDALSNSKTKSEVMDKADGGALRDAISSNLSDKRDVANSLGISAQHQEALSKSYSTQKQISKTSQQLDSIARTTSLSDNVSSFDVVTKNRGETSNIYRDFDAKLKDYDDSHNTNYSNILHKATDAAKWSLPEGVAGGDSEEIAQYEALRKFNSGTSEQEINSLIMDAKSKLVISTADAYGWTNTDFSSSEQIANTGVDVSGVKQDLSGEFSSMDQKVKDFNKKQEKLQEAPLKYFKKNDKFVRSAYKDAEKANDENKKAKILDERAKNFNPDAYNAGSNSTPGSPEELEYNHSKHSTDYQREYSKNRPHAELIKSSYETVDNEEQVLESLVDLRTKASVLKTTGTAEARKAYEEAQKSTKQLLIDYAKTQGQNSIATDYANSMISEFGYSNAGRSESDILNDLTKNNKSPLLPVAGMN